LRDKITKKRNWKITRCDRVCIHNATYRQALSYRNQLRLVGVKDILEKPVEW